MFSKVIQSYIIKLFPKLKQKATLLSTIISLGFIVLMPYSYQKECNLGKNCLVANLELSRYLTYVQLNLLNYNVWGLSLDQLNKITLKHCWLEEELEAVEEEVQLLNMKILYLWKQKWIWYKKMMRVIYQGIDNLEELERIENEEAKAKHKRITKQSIEVICGSSPSSSRMEL